MGGNGRKQNREKSRGRHRNGDYLSFGKAEAVPLDIPSQLYLPGTPEAYQSSFADDGTWDGGIGCTSNTASQPDVLTGMEALTYAMEWPEVGLMQSGYILIKGTTMTVAQVGGAMQYTIDT